MQLSERYEAALQLAFRLHRTQERKGSSVPYIAHLLGVSSLALEYGGDEDEAIAALLHDAVEDQGGETTLAEIRTRFGPRVADIVLGCSDWPGTGSKPPWRERKEQYLRHLETAAPSVLLVSACDKLYNARTILADIQRDGQVVWTRFTAGRDGSLWYYRSLATRFRALQSPLASELDGVVSHLEALSRSATAP
jgi:(p)ppGpp synthase/HD superfamily hydrolase